MSAHTEALRKCVEVLKQVDFKDCAESPELWHQHGLALAEAERVLREGEKQEPVAYMAFADNGNVRVWAGKDNLGAKEAAEKNGLVLQPVYTRPAPSPTAVVAVPEGWQFAPITATDEMLEAWKRAISVPIGSSPETKARRAYKDMMSAAPQPSVDNVVLTKLHSAFIESHPDHMGFTGSDEALISWGKRNRPEILAAPQPAAAPSGLASFYLAAHGLTCTHEVDDCTLPVWCKDSTDAYNALRIISSLYNRANLRNPEPSGDVERVSIMEAAAKLCDFQATWAKGEADDEENSVRYRHENRERQIAAELCAASIRAAITATKEGGA